MAAPIDDWSSRWAELKKHDRLSWYYFFGLVVLLLAAHALGFPGFVAMLLSAPILLWIAIANWRMRDFSCPRCGEHFFRKRWSPFSRETALRRKCIHCGLEKFTPSYAAKPFEG